jgi:hypothetical protein
MVEKSRKRFLESITLEVTDEEEEQVIINIHILDYGE